MREENGNLAVREKAMEWLGDVVKVAGPAILALCVMWVKVESHAEDLRQIQRAAESVAARVQQAEMQLVVLREAQRADAREFSVVLRRLEEMVRDLRADAAKEAQRK